MQLRTQVQLLSVFKRAFQISILSYQVLQESAISKAVAEYCRWLMVSPRTCNWWIISHLGAQRRSVRLSFFRGRTVGQHSGRQSPPAHEKIKPCQRAPPLCVYTPGQGDDFYRYPNSGRFMNLGLVDQPECLTRYFRACLSPCLALVSAVA